MSFSVEGNEVRTLELDLSRAPMRVQLGITKNLSTKGARTMERAMRNDARGHQGNWFGRPGTSYDTPLERHVSSEMLSPFELETGIEAKGAGNLGHIIAYGSVKNAPAYDPMSGPRKALPLIAEQLGDMAEDEILEGGRS